MDRFYHENEDMIPPQQYEAAKNNFEYFMRLVDLAMAYYRERDKWAERCDSGIIDNKYLSTHGLVGPDH